MYDPQPTRRAAPMRSAQMTGTSYAVCRVIKAMTHVQLPLVDVVVWVVDDCFCAETAAGTLATFLHD